MADYPNDSGLGDPGYNYSSIAEAVVTGNVPQTIQGTKTFTAGIVAQAGIVGNIVGDITGDITGDIIGNITGTVSGMAVGNSGYSGKSGYSGAAAVSGYSGTNGASGYSGIGTSGYSGFSGIGTSGYSGSNGTSGYSGPAAVSGYSGYTGSVKATGTLTLALAGTTDQAQAAVATGNKVFLTPTNAKGAAVVLGGTNTPSGIYVSAISDGVGFTVTHDNHADAEGATFFYLVTT